MSVETAVGPSDYSVLKHVVGIWLTAILAACSTEEDTRNDGVKVNTVVYLAEGTQLYPTPTIIGRIGADPPRPCAILRDGIEGTVVKVTPEHGIGFYGEHWGFQKSELFPLNPEVCADSPDGIIYAQGVNVGPAHP